MNFLLFSQNISEKSVIFWPIPKYMCVFFKMSWQVPDIRWQFELKKINCWVGQSQIKWLLRRKLELSGIGFVLYCMCVSRFYACYAYHTFPHVIWEEHVWRIFQFLHHFIKCNFVRMDYWKEASVHVRTKPQVHFRYGYYEAQRIWTTLDWREN